MRKIKLAVILFVFFIFCAVSFSHTAADQPVPRDIEVCLCTHAQCPIHQIEAVPIVDQVFLEYQSHFTVRFVVKKVALYEGDLNLGVIKNDAFGVTPEAEHVGYELQKICPNVDIIILLTNKPYSEQKRYYSGYVRTVALAGIAYEKMGYAVLFDVDDLLSKKDEGGNLWLTTTTRHELGHLFGADHLDDEESFMYEAVSPSHGKYTPQTIKEIEKNKSVVWSRRTATAAAQ